MGLYLESKDDILVNLLESPSTECLQYLQDRLSLMRKVADNNIATALRTLTAKNLTKTLEEGNNSHNQDTKSKDISKVSKNIVQLLRNELKLLEMLVHSCKEFKNTVHNNSIKDSSNSTNENKENPSENNDDAKKSSEDTPSQPVGTENEKAPEENGTG